MDGLKTQLRNYGLRKVKGTTPPAYAEQSGNAILTGDNIDEVLKLKKIEKNGAPAQPRVDDPSTIPGRSDADFAVNDMVIDAKNGEETFGARGKIVDITAKRNWITVQMDHDGTEITRRPTQIQSAPDGMEAPPRRRPGRAPAAAPPASAPAPPPKKRGRATTGSAAAKKPAEKRAKKHKGTGGEVQGSPAQVSQSLDREDDDAQPELPVIAMPPSSIKPDGVCKLLLEDILFHEHVPNTIHRGNIGEVIFAMIATKIFNCSWSDVEIVGAHAAREMRSGPGDEGRDIIIRVKPPRIVDFKAWSTNGPRIGAKDARSIGGALGAMEITDEGGIGIVATNHDFTANAVRYRDDFNNYSGDLHSKSVELWNGGKLKDKIKSAIKKWPGQSSGFITDVLCYLDKKELIKLTYPDGETGKKESQRELAQRAGVTNLGSLFNPPSLDKPSRKRTSSQRDD